MKAAQLLSLPLIVALSMPVLARDKDRLWTDNAGQKTEAEFVRVHEGQVILRRGNRMITVPFENLSPADQQYLRGELAAKGQSDLLPPPVDGAEGGEPSMPADGTVNVPPPAQPPVAASPSAGGMPRGGLPPALVRVETPLPAPGPVRAWKDEGGRQMVAQFVGVEGNQVNLLKDGQRVSYPFASLSPVDQQYVRSELMKRGQSDLIPNLLQPAADPFTPAEPPVASVVEPRMPEPSAPPEMPASPPAETAATPLEPASSPFAGAEGAPESPAQPDAAEPSEMSSAAPVAVAPQGEGPPASADASQAPSPRPANVKLSDYACGNCNELLPFHFSFGQRCPNCKARVMFESPGDGAAARASDIVFPKWWLGVGGVGGLVAVAAAFFLGGSGSRE